MNTPRPREANPDPEVLFSFQREHFALLNVLWLLLAFANLLVAIVTGSVHAYRLLPCWFLLLAVTAASSLLKDMKLVVWVAVVALCVSIEFLRYQVYNAEIAIRTFASYAPLTAFMLILLSNSLEERTKDKEHTEALLKKLRSEANDQLNHLKKLRSGELEKGAEEQELVLARKHACFEFYREFFPRILQIRYRRDISSLLHEASEQGFGLQMGVIYEIPEEKQAEVHVRTRWGIPKTPQADEAVARYARSDLVRRTTDERAALQVDQIKRHPNLYEEYDRMSADLFTPECLIPVLLLGRTVFVMVVGMPSPRGRVEYQFSALNPIVQGCGQAISKLAQKDGRRAFSTFGT